MLAGDFFEIYDQNGLPWFNALLPSLTFMNVLFYIDSVIRWHS